MESVTKKDLRELLEKARQHKDSPITFSAILEDGIVELLKEPEVAKLLENNNVALWAGGEKCTTENCNHEISKHSRSGVCSAEGCRCLHFTLNTPVQTTP